MEIGHQCGRNLHSVWVYHGLHGARAASYSVIKRQSLAIVKQLNAKEGFSTDMFVRVVSRLDTSRCDLVVCSSTPKNG